MQDHAAENMDSFPSNARDSKEDVQLKPQYNGVVEPQISALIIDHDKKDADQDLNKGKDGLPSISSD